MKRKIEMAIQSQFLYVLFGSFISLVMGVLFTFIVGDLNPPHYLLELMSQILVELPFIAIYALLVRKFDWLIGFVYLVLGSAASFAVVFPEMSITPIVFLKIALMGLILGKKNWFYGSFIKRISAVAVPGIIIAFLFGLPLIFYGVAPETLDEIRQDSLEIYQAFMSEDDALNTVDNAMFFFKGIFKVGFAIYFLFAYIQSWFSFVFTGWLIGKFNETAEYVPYVYSFKLPFHAVWVLLLGGTLWVIGYELTTPLASNILAVMAGFYGIQGLAIVTYHINGISIGRLPKVLFWVIFLLMIGFFSVFLIIVGIIDSWFNLRSFPYYISGGKEGDNNESNS